MTIARNAPCPCGSGKKFKRCCGAVGATPIDLDSGEDTNGAASPERSNGTGRVAAVLIGISVAIGVGAGTAMEAVSSGLAVGMACVMASLIYLMARKPPESTGRGGGTAINFGLTSRGNRRGNAPQNRRQRRRK